MKKGTKIIASALSAGIIAASFCGCSGGKNSAEDVVKGQKDIKDFEMWAVMDSASTQTLSSYNDMLMYQKMSEATGINVKFIHPVAGSDGNEAFNTLMASGKLPDMIETTWTSYDGGAQAAIDDGVIIALNDYLKEYAPNYYEYVEGKKNDENGGLYKRQSMTDDGNFYGFKNLNIGEIRGFGGIYVRKDLIDKWGLDVPETLDDWTKVFETAKNNGIEKPFTCSNSFAFSVESDVFNTIFNVGKSFYLDGKTVKFGPFEAGYKDYTATLADWYSKGYIDPGFVTNTSDEIEGNMANGLSIASFGFVGSGIGKILPAAKVNDPNFSVVACPYPVKNKGDKPHFQNLNPESNDPAIGITKDCGNYGNAMKWCDYLYSDEGSILSSFGVEGDTYKKKDGHYVYTDKITNFESVGASSVNGALYKFFRPANGPGLNQHPDYLEGYYTYDEQKDAIKVWNEYVDEARKYTLPPVTFTADEQNEITEVKELGEANLNSGITDIIRGKKDISEYDSLISAAKKAGYDRMLEIYQDAYDRYLARG